MLHLTTLGLLRLERDGTPLPLPQPKRVALLAYLALSQPGVLHRRDVLLGMFWPELPESRARNALRQALHQLRVLCGDEVLVTRGMHEVGISPDGLRCDVRALEAAAARGDAAAGAAAYGGDLLPGLFAVGAPGWEDWLTRERTRLRSLARDAGRTLAHAARDAGAPAMAARWVQWTCGLDPLDEAAARWGMQLLAECGLPGAALQLFEHFAALSEKELGVHPGEETSAIAAALRTADAMPAPPGRVRTVAVPASAPPALAAAVLAPPRLRGRRVRSFALGGALLATLLAVVAHRGSGDPGPRRERVAVLPFRGVGAGASTETAERVRAALASSGLDVVAPEAAGGRGGAGTLVSGILYPDPAGLRARVTVSDAVSGSVVASVAALLPTGDTVAAGALADRVLAAVATHADPVFGWVGPTSRPSGSVAHRAFVAGLRALRDERGGDAAGSFRRAAEADDGFALAWLMVGALAMEDGRRAAADSVIRRLVARRATLAPVDQKLLEWLERSAARDRPGALAAMDELARAAPGLEIAHYQAAVEAVRCNRPGEALRHLDRIDPARGFSRKWASYWATRADALHMARRHQDELRHLRRGLALHPELVVLRDYELRALAALGRADEVLRRIDEYAVIPPRGGWSPGVAMRHAGMELRAHGHEAAAAIALRGSVAAARAQASAGTPAAEAELAEALILANEHQEALRVVTRLHARRPDCRGCAVARAVLAARAGDRAPARRLDAELASGPRTAGSLLGRARIAAVLGDRAGARRLVREAVARGYPYDALAHADPDLGTLFPS